MERHDNPYNLFENSPHIRVKMVHLHPGNSTKKQRKNSKFFSYLSVWYSGQGEGADDSFIVTSQCCDEDTPSRKRAREVLRMKAAAVAKERGWVV